MLGLPGQLEGGQAEYVRVPLADTTAVRAPDSEFAHIHMRTSY